MWSNQVLPVHLSPPDIFLVQLGTPQPWRKSATSNLLFLSRSKKNTRYGRGQLNKTNKLQNKRGTIHGGITLEQRGAHVQVKHKRCIISFQMRGYHGGRHKAARTGRCAQAHCSNSGTTLTFQSVFFVLPNMDISWTFVLGNGRVPRRRSGCLRTGNRTVPFEGWMVRCVVGTCSRQGRHIIMVT